MANSLDLPDPPDLPTLPDLPDPFDPLGPLRAALTPAADAPEGGDLRLDLGREARTGVPEIVYAPGKTAAQLVAAARGLVVVSGRAIVSRVDAAALAALQAGLPEYTVEISAGMRTALVFAPAYAWQSAGGRVGILTGGTSDLPTADEARVVAWVMGCTVRVVADVGVAGLHRLFPPLAHLFAWPADVLIVAAGMDGALPSVVAGLAPMPVIGLPTPVGYGAGGAGAAALGTMLQSCAPGLVVVNIDNGVGAGVAAAKIANAASHPNAPAP